jgi:hypothetical protein
MIGSFRREIFGHWLEPEEPEQPKKSNVDLRQLLSEPGALKELASFFKAVKGVEKEQERKKAKAKKSKK